MRIHRLVAFPLLLGGLAAPLHAQSGDGYLFSAPDARLSLHTGYAHADARSDVFDFVIANLTLDRSSFSGPSVGADLAVTISPRFDLSFGIDYSAAMRNSEDRGYLDNNNLPIEQTTTFRRMPLMGNAIVYLASRGRSIGTLAWVPSRVVPWIGAGGGTLWYQFRQEGDFVDYQTLNVFSTTLESSGWVPAYQALGGVDATLSPRLAVTADVHRVWAKGTLSRDFRNFDQKIDLSGVTGALGITVRL